MKLTIEDAESISKLLEFKNAREPIEKEDISLLNKIESIIESEVECFKYHYKKYEIQCETESKNEKTVVDLLRIALDKKSYDDEIVYHIIKGFELRKTFSCGVGFLIFSVDIFSISMRIMYTTVKKSHQIFISTDDGLTYNQPIISINNDELNIYQREQKFEELL